MSTRCDDWAHLPGKRVEVRRYGRFFRTALVDAVMPDQSALWLALEENDTRVMVHAGDGYEMWSVSAVATTTE